MVQAGEQADLRPGQRARLERARQLGEVLERAADLRPVLDRAPRLAEALARVVAEARVAERGPGRALHQHVGDSGQARAQRTAGAGSRGHQALGVEVGAGQRHVRSIHEIKAKVQRAKGISYSSLAMLETRA
jgi:hypothetical protein